MLWRLIRDLKKAYIRNRASQLSASFHDARALAARNAGQPEMAELHYRKALELDPVSAILHYNLGLLMLELGKILEAERYLARSIELDSSLQIAQSCFLGLSDFSLHLTRREILERHVAWASANADPCINGGNRSWGPKISDRPLRIGYVSADFRRHAIGRFVEPVLQYHDRNRFAVFCYHNGLEQDDMTRHLQQLADKWRDVNSMTDSELAAKIRSDEIDILIDLSGHSAGNRLLAMAQKPARMQVTWMGYLNTTGMKAMDFRLTDWGADPQGVDCWYRERLLRLPHSQWCYAINAGPVSAPMSSVLPRDIDAPVLFACVTRFMKINEDVVELWMKILNRLPNSRLRIIGVPNHPVRDALMDRFRSERLSDRLELLPLQMGEGYWSCLSEIDIALDTFPYTGATTTCDCLWMGIPVVTFSGVCGAARSATSLLRIVGLGDLAVDSREAYIERAVRLGGNRCELARIRSSLRDVMMRSAICDGRQFTLDLENALFEAWRDL